MKLAEDLFGGTGNEAKQPIGVGPDNVNPMAFHVLVAGEAECYQILTDVQPEF